MTPLDVDLHVTESRQQIASSRVDAECVSWHLDFGYRAKCRDLPVDHHDGLIPKNALPVHRNHCRVKERDGA
jgi:hypothetical protein